MMRSTAQQGARQPTPSKKKSPSQRRRDDERLRQHTQRKIERAVARRIAAYAGGDQLAAHQTAVELYGADYDRPRRGDAGYLIGGPEREGLYWKKRTLGGGFGTPYNDAEAERIPAEQLAMRVELRRLWSALTAGAVTPDDYLGALKMPDSRLLREAGGTDVPPALHTRCVPRGRVMSTTVDTPLTVAEWRVALRPYADTRSAGYRCPLCPRRLRFDHGHLTGCADAADLERLAREAADAGLLDRRRST